MSGSAPSYSFSPSELPLLGETIGANLDRIVDRAGRTGCPRESRDDIAATATL